MEYSTFLKKFPLQWSWLRNEQSRFQMYAFMHSVKFYEKLICHWWRDWFFNNVLCCKVQLKIKQCKAMIQYSKNQKIKPYTTSAFILQDTEFAKLCLKRPCDRMNLLILRRKSRSIRWNSVLKTEEQFLSLIWMLLPSIKFLM